MKRTWLWFSLAALFFAGLVWSSRGFLREYLEAVRQPMLPPAVTYHVDENIPSTPTTTPAKKPSRPVAATSSRVLPPPASLLQPPKEVNLAVPFLSQAPKQNWAMPYQEACEEASMIMVDAYFVGRSKAFSPEEGDRAILDIVAYEDEQNLGPDLTGKQVIDVITKYFAKHQARLILRPSSDDIKALLAKGIPVIIPADGKALKNPNFRNGGPPYHMLVIKGFLADGRWIVNDPGTRKGADYIYDHDLLMNAIHDWNGGDVPHGVPMIVVMQPSKD